MLVLCNVFASLQKVTDFLDPEGGSQKATLVVLVFVFSSLRVQNPFLNTQRRATKFCKHSHADIAHRSTVSDFPLIF